MNRTLKLVCLCACLLAVSVNGYSWGQKGHDVTCAIAQKHLTRKAEKKISAILDGKSIVYWANWMDNASHTPEYQYTSTWHYKNIDADETFETAQINKDGDVLIAVNKLATLEKVGKVVDAVVVERVGVESLCTVLQHHIVASVHHLVGSVVVGIVACQRQGVALLEMHMSESLHRV